MKDPQVKVEPDEEDGYSSFDEFPAGAVRVPYHDVMAWEATRLAAHAAVRRMDRESSEDSFDDFVPESPQHQELVDREAMPSPPATPVAAPARPVPEVMNEVMSVLNRVLETETRDDTVEMTATITKTGQETKVTWSVLKTAGYQRTPQRPSDQQRVEDEESQGSTSSSIRPPSSRRRLRVPSSSSGDDEEDDPIGVDQDQTTPTKRGGPNATVVTPSPAKRMRGLNLTAADSSSDSEEDEEEEESEDLIDTQEDDPDYVPDSQEAQDRPSDFVVPRTAAHDSLDLEY